MRSFENTTWMKALLLTAVTVLFTTMAGAQAPSPRERMEAIKSSFQQSQAVLHKYQWVETMTVSVKGDVKSTKQSQCYYGAEGTLQKVPVAPAPQGKPSKKQEEMTDYMKQAVETIKQYVPPDPKLIQKSYEDGHVSFFPAQPGKPTQISFGSFLKPNDSLMLSIDTGTNRITGVQIQTYIDSPKDSVGLNVFYSTFPDGTIYPAKTVLNAPAKKIQVSAENTGYRLTGN